MNDNVIRFPVERTRPPQDESWPFRITSDTGEERFAEDEGGALLAAYYIQREHPYEGVPAVSISLHDQHVFTVERRIRPNEVGL